MTETKGLLNYSTSVPASRTISEMQAALARSGARKVMLEYDDQGNAHALMFSLPTPHGERFYTLPCDVAAVERVLRQQDADGLIRKSSVKVNRAQAERVAWRVLKDWLEAQLALVRTQMAALDQVMLPYLHVDADHTLYAAWAESEARALPSSTS